MPVIATCAIHTETLGIGTFGIGNAGSALAIAEQYCITACWDSVDYDLIGLSKPL
jgi:hypothetical protein